MNKFRRVPVQNVSIWKHQSQLDICYVRVTKTRFYCNQVKTIDLSYRGYEQDIGCQGLGLRLG